MKKCAFLLRLYMLILLMSPGTRPVVAQQLVVEGKQWNLLASPGFSPNLSSYTLSLSGDTLVGAHSFLKVWRSDDSLHQNRYFTGRLLREDEQQRIWVKAGHEAEALLYDFGLEAGDSVVIREKCTAYLVETDTVVLNNGARRKRMHFSIPDAVGARTQSWIEGIGSRSGLLDHWDTSCQTDVGGGLLCHFEEGLLVYPENPASCFLVPAREPSPPVQLRVYPNPTPGLLKIEGEGGEWKNVKLLDLRGRVIRNWDPKERAHILDISVLSAGLYFLQGETGTGRFHTLKIVKQD